MGLFQSEQQAAAFLAKEPLLSVLRHVNADVTMSDCELLADQMLLLVRDYYVHLPLKTSSLAIDPVQELTLLLDDVKYLGSPGEFFRRVLGTVKRLRDRHTT